MIQGVTRQQIPINGWISRWFGQFPDEFFSSLFSSCLSKRLKDVGYTKANPNIAHEKLITDVCFS